MAYDLYLFRDAPDRNPETVFYIGQSDNAFRRVWRHLEDGFKGRSLVGKFVFVNWPRSMNATIELLDSGYRESDDPASCRNDMERHLIEKYRPCFNATWNEEPMPLPLEYEPPTSNVRFARHLKQLMREASIAVERDRKNTANASEW